MVPRIGIDPIQPEGVCFTDSATSLAAYRGNHKHCGIFTSGTNHYPKQINQYQLRIMPAKLEPETGFIPAIPSKYTDGVLSFDTTKA